MKRSIIGVCAAALTIAAVADCQPYFISTVAGSDPVRDGKPAERGILESARSVVFESSGRMLIADFSSHRVRAVTPDTRRTIFAERYRMGEIRTLAGRGGSAFSGDGGPAIAAHLSYPSELATEDSGTVFVAVSGRIRRIDPDGSIQTFAGGGTGSDADGAPAISFALSTPTGLATDGKGNLYYSDSRLAKVRRIGSDGTVVTVAGGGPLGLEADGGPAIAAKLLLPGRLLVDSEGNVLICERGRYAVRKVTPDGRISTVAGTGVRGYGGDGGPATKAQLMSPVGAVLDNAGNLLILDAGNSTIRAVSPDGIMKTFWGPVPYISGLTSIALAPSGGLVMTGSTVGVMSLEGKSEVYLVQSGFPVVNDIAATETLLEYPTAVTSDAEGHIYVVDSGRIRGVDHQGMIVSFADGYYNMGSVDQPSIYSSNGIWADRNGDLWIGDYYRILHLKRSDGSLKWLAGTGRYGDTGNDGPAAAAQIETPNYFAVAVDGTIFLRSAASHTIRRVGPDGVIRRFAGSGQRGFSGDDGPATDAQFSSPAGLAVGMDGTLYVADFGNRRIRAVSPAGIVTTFAGGGATAGDGPAREIDIPGPMAVAVGPERDVFFSTATAIFRVDASGWLERIAGGSLPGYGGDNGPARDALLNDPNSVWVDQAGIVYVSEGGNHRVRRLARSAN